MDIRNTTLSLVDAVKRTTPIGSDPEILPTRKSFGSEGSDGIYDDPAICIGLAIHWARFASSSGNHVPQSVAELLIDHALNGDLASEIVVAWMFSKGLISSLEQAPAQRLGILDDREDGDETS